jgi:hypothetical protein
LAVNPDGFVRGPGRFVCALTRHAVTTFGSAGTADGPPIRPCWTVATAPWALLPPMTKMVSPTHCDAVDVLLNIGDCSFQAPRAPVVPVCWLFQTVWSARRRPPRPVRRCCPTPARAALARGAA